LDLKQAVEFGRLGSIPFDRLIVAAARTAGCALVTADEKLSASGLVDVAWD
jgi:PIN domain nuclease of toxin-antitoxin system